MKRKREMNRKKSDDELLQGIKVRTDNILEEIETSHLEKPPNFIVLDDIELDEEEKEYLDVHFKCREFSKLENIDVNIEVTKLGIKH